VNHTKLLPFILDYITAKDSKLGLSRRKFVEDADQAFHERAENFYRRYQLFIESQGKSLEFGLDCFLHLQHNLEQQRIRFLETGRYQNTSFAEVNRCVYANPEVMQYHMHGLVFAQFLWPDQYRRFQFFSDHLCEWMRSGQRYLEIGGGHALYVTEAARLLPSAAIDVVDISQTSLEMARGIANEPRIQYHLMNVFDFPDGQYDFITMGEVLEHMEHPRELLEKLRRLLAPGGHAYITTPTNAPMIDHIHLFHNAGEIREMLTSCGFRIESEATRYAVDISEKLAERMKLPLMYAAFIAKA
jgi:2-polyprenyl-3-methyl-5-hydroxy-6-metoxy-1,4-benzoquinol methylase